MPVDFSLRADHADTDAARRSQRQAWLSLALTPVAFVVSMLVGDFLLDLLGSESGAEELPPRVPRMLAGIPATLLAWPALTYDRSPELLATHLDPAVAEATVLSRDGLHAPALILLGMALVLVAGLLVHQMRRAPGGPETPARPPEGHRG